MCYPQYLWLFLAGKLIQSQTHWTVEHSLIAAVISVWKNLECDGKKIQTSFPLSKK